MYTYPSFHSLVHLKSLCLAFRFLSYQHTNTHQRTGSTEQHRILHLVCKKGQTFHWLVFPSIQMLPDAPFDTWSDRLRREINKNFLTQLGITAKKNKAPKLGSGSPIGPHLGVPDILVLGISRPYLSTHQQNEVRERH